MTRGHWAAAALATAVVAATAVTLPAHASDPAAAAKPAAGASRAITLVTGDKVQLRGNQVASVEPGRGRESLQMLRWTAEGHSYVVPSDALELISAGRLDRRLFDVTELLAARYDDAASPTTPLLVQYESGVAAAARPSLLAKGRRVKALKRASFSALRQDKKSTAALWSGLTGGTAKRALTGPLGTGVRTVWLDGVKHLDLDVSVPQIGAPAAWQAGYTGAGVKVAVLDGGVSTGHPDLQGQVVETANFTDEPDWRDYDGHATHVASIIAGTGAASGGKYRGVTSGVKLYSAKVCATGCLDSAIIDGMTWAAERGAKIVNMSLGGFAGEVDPVEKTLEDLTRQYGTLFVVSAGNEGLRGHESITSPAEAPSALAVGNVTKSNELAPKSSRGPGYWTKGVKPEVVAPGTNIVAARAQGTLSDYAVDDNYASLSGTSMAAPHVTGAAAIVAQQHPDWTGQQIKSALVGSARSIGAATVYQQGAGLIDVGAAVSRPAVASPATVSFGRVYSGDPAAQPVQEKTVTYQNSGPRALTLDLALTAAGVDGSPAPDGTVTVSPAQLSVPAGGTATATVTIDVRDRPFASYGGVLTAASGGDVLVRTPVGGTHQSMHFAQTFTTIDRAGSATASSKNWLTLVSWATGKWYPTSAVGGGFTAAMPAGDYLLFASVYTPASAGRPASRSILIRKHLHLVADGSTTLDARQAHALSYEVPGKPEAAIASAELQIQVGTGASSFWVSVRTGYASREDVGALYLDAVEPGPDVRSLVRASLARPDGKGSFDASPYAYHLLSTLPGRVPNEAEPVDESQLAAVHEHYGAGLPGERVTMHTAGSIDVDGQWYRGYAEEMLKVPLPLERTEYFSPGPATWSQSMYIEGAGVAEDSAQTSYVAGREYDSAWNSSIYGPTVRSGYGRRSGKYLTVSAELFSPGTPGRQGSDYYAFGSGYPASGTVNAYVDGAEVWANRSGTGFDVTGSDQAADYRLELSGTRPAVGSPPLRRPTSRVDLTWAFHLDAASTSGQTESLPLMAVMFDPQLDESHRAPAGSTLRLPIAVERQASAPQAEVTALTLQASFDEGATWVDVPVDRDGAGWVASVEHPASAEAGTYVDLRTKATAADGASVEETLHRAYQLG